jgi:ethanolamine ammonia-lyase small subunit
VNRELEQLAPEELLSTIRLRTPARLLAGRAGTGYRTDTQLQLRGDHAFARDAVHAEFDVRRDLGEEFATACGLFEVQTQARSKAEFLLRPDLGRKFGEPGSEQIRRLCPVGADWQIVIGDGLSAIAAAAQVPELLPLLQSEGQRRGWSAGRPFVVRHCRVGILNEIGELLDPTVVVLLIGERPGLATAESLSAYMAYRPRPDHTDAQRNLISNIHGRGVSHADAARRITVLAEQMMREKRSGVTVKEPQANL